MRSGLSKYRLTIYGSSIGTSEISSIINIPLPWLEFVGFIIHWLSFDFEESESICCL